MPVIELETTINAPVERVFDLARCIDLHTESMGRSSEKAVGGVMSGLINLGQTVTWEAVHFGIRQRLTSAITQFDRPRHFRDSMVSGAFRSIDHDHFFEPAGHGTIMKDVFAYTSPLGLLGAAADRVFLKRYMTGLLEERNGVIKRVAENEEWRKFIS
jgi:ligand-binding SRPBCC domain-containing protein